VAWLIHPDKHQLFAQAIYQQEGYAIALLPGEGWSSPVGSGEDMLISVERSSPQR
jgi:hypothetical protein